MMDIKIMNNSEEIAAYAADMLEQLLLEKPGAVLGLATGSTPLPLYRELAARCRDGKIDFRRAATFNLDEYTGLGEEDPQSFHYFMERNLFQKINVRKENIHLLHGKTADSKKECEEYEELIKKAGGIDWQLLGIGGNGHIGFNEPEDTFSLHVREVFLTEETITANARFFEEKDAVPRKAMTMGIRNILEAKTIVLIAEGRGKAEAVRAMIEGEVTPRVPASALQNHKDVTVLLDREAAGCLGKIR